MRRPTWPQRDLKVRRLFSIDYIRKKCPARGPSGHVPPQSAAPGAKPRAKKPPGTPASPPQHPPHPPGCPGRQVAAALKKIYWCCSGAPGCGWNKKHNHIYFEAAASPCGRVGIFSNPILTRKALIDAAATPPRETAPKRHGALASRTESPPANSHGGCLPPPA
jgi:hypothetical protein